MQFNGNFSLAQGNYKAVKAEQKTAKSGKDYFKAVTPIENRPKDGAPVTVWVELLAYGKLGELLNARLAHNGRIFIKENVLQIDEETCQLPTWKDNDGNTRINMSTVIKSADIVDWKEVEETEPIKEEEEFPF